jgi:taurine transport system permease protein
MLPSLTNEKYLESETVSIVDELTVRINELTEEFPKDSYPSLSEEEKSKRTEALKKQQGWGATGMEVPPIPETKVGLKFHAASQELAAISDEFFEARNHNPEYLKRSGEIFDEIMCLRDGLDENQELETRYIKEIKKLNQRIEYASIFPPSTLIGLEKSIRAFDKVQRDEQGSIRTKDIFLFPSGTIVASGPTCAEDGP